jgi:hypothetical protein
MQASPDLTNLGDCSRLSASTINLLNQLSELAGNVGSVAIQNGSITRADLTRVVEDDDLGVEGSSLLGGVVLGVGGDVSTDVPIKILALTETFLTLKPTLSPGRP